MLIETCISSGLTSNVYIPAGIRYAFMCAGYIYKLVTCKDFVLNAKVWYRKCML